MIGFASLPTRAVGSGSALTCFRLFDFVLGPGATRTASCTWVEAAACKVALIASMVTASS